MNNLWRHILCPQLRDEQLPFGSQVMKRKLATLQATMLRSSSSAAPPDESRENLAVGVDEPVAVGALSRKRLTGKQSAPQFPRLQNQAVQGPVAHDWKRVSGVSHSSLTDEEFGVRCSFQDHIQRAAVSKSKLYFPNCFVQKRQRTVHSEKIQSF